MPLFYSKFLRDDSLFDNESLYREHSIMSPPAVVLPYKRAPAVHLCSFVRCQAAPAGSLPAGRGIALTSRGRRSHKAGFRSLRDYRIIVPERIDDARELPFFVKYGEERAMLSISELKVLEGKLPRRALALVLEWANEHRQELMDNWKSLETTGDYSKIPPLE